MNYRKPSSSPNGHNEGHSAGQNHNERYPNSEIQSDGYTYNEDQNEGHFHNENEFVKGCQESNWSDAENLDFEFDIDDYIESRRDASQMPPNRPKDTQVRRTAVVRHPRNTHLSNFGKYFRDKFYELIKNKTRNNIIKPCVIHYHELARNINNLIHPMTRKEKRNLNLYYNNHALEMHLILNAIARLQNQGIINYPVDSTKF